MAALKSIKGKSLKLILNKDGKTSSKSYADIGTAASDDSILETAKAIGSIITHPVEDRQIITTESLKESLE